MSEVYPSGAYRDPADIADTLRRIERKVDNCQGCAHDGGTAWGQQLCEIGRRLDADGYCGKWEAKLCK